MLTKWVRLAEGAGLLLHLLTCYVLGKGLPTEELPPEEREA